MVNEILEQLLEIVAPRASLCRSRASETTCNRVLGAPWSLASFFEGGMGRDSCDWGVDGSGGAGWFDLGGRRGDVRCRALPALVGGGTY